MTDDSVRTETKTRSREQQLLISELRGLEMDFIALCKRIGNSRDLSLAITYMEDASMRAVRHIIGDAQ